MRILLDTNILVAALVARGACADLLEHCVREHLVVTSQALLDELSEVLTGKFRQREHDVQAAVRLFKHRFTLVSPEPISPPVCRDRDDDLVLGTALAGAGVAILTGDQDLLVLDPFRDVRVLAPSAFWEWESTRDEGSM